MTTTMTIMVMTDCLLI